jgi:hypothetical protein
VEYVVAFARALNRSPVEAMVAAGFITAEEAGAEVEIRPALVVYSTDEILEELRRRTVNGTG